MLRINMGKRGVFRKVDAEYVSLGTWPRKEGHRFFIDRRPATRIGKRHVYIVSELESGLRVGVGVTKQNAINDAAMRVYQYTLYGARSLDHFVKRGIRRFGRANQWRRA